jgi:phospholipase/carboxylesterase
MNTRLLLITTLLSASLTYAAAAESPYLTPEQIDPLAGDALALLEQPREQYYLAGLQAQQQDDYRTAASCYLAALQSDSTDFDLLFRLATCYGQLGEGSLAADTLRLAQERGMRHLSQALTDPRFDAVREDYLFSLTADVIRLREQRYAGQLGQTMYVPLSILGKLHYFLPDDYDPQREYTLLVMLHGATGTPENVAAWYQQMPSHDFILAAPEAPYPVFSSHQDSRVWWSAGDLDPAELERSVLQSADYVLEVVNACRERFSISRVVLAGFSQGGMLATVVALRQPQLCDGLACFSTALPELSAEETAQLDMPVFVGHGRFDTVIAPQHGLELAGKLEELGGRTSLYMFNGGHEITALELEAFCAWLADPLGELPAAAAEQAALPLGLMQ